MVRYIWKAFVFMVAVVFLANSAAVAKIVPEQHSRVQYFYVFGPEGDKLLGKEDSEQAIFIDIPQEKPCGPSAKYWKDVLISVYDPDTGGKKDYWRSVPSAWDTTTEFAVYGNKLLEKKQFSEDARYDMEYFNFGPYSRTKGEKVGNVYRFKLVAKTLKGDDANLFKVKVQPEDAEIFVTNITFRLARNKGDKMYFYPQAPAGTKHIVVENYDIDVKGGKSVLVNPKNRRSYRINDSKTGQWSTTKVPIEVSKTGRLKYIITKGTQSSGHAGLVIKDDLGQRLPIYFQKGRPPLVKSKPVAITRAPVKKPAPKPAPPQKPDCNTFTFDATDSYDEDNHELSFLWDFGDGQTSTEPIVTHTFDKGGDYKVTLTVTDNSGMVCDSATTYKMVRVNTPPHAAFNAPQLTCTQQNITFDASPTVDETSPDLTYSWKFGDGTTKEGRVVNKSYEKGGSYKVTLRVDDNENTTCSTDTLQKIMRVNTPPIADAGEDVTMHLKSFDDEYRVTFDASGSKDADGDNLTYNWNFGDGAQAEGRCVTHTYKRSGGHKVTLVVDDGSGSSCSNDADSLVVYLNKPPVASAGDDRSICVHDRVTFDGNSSFTEQGENLTYTWDFGDGNKAAGPRVTHKYAKGGKYYASLTVDDNMGTEYSRSTDVAIVNVNSLPIANLQAPEQACTGRVVTFDASASQDADGDALKFRWDLGDGTTKEAASVTNHTYNKGGVYAVKVLVDDGKGSKCSQSQSAARIYVNTPPVADAGPNTACCAGAETRFDGSKSYDPDGDRLSYKWDFGDGSTAIGPRVSHVYEKTGKYVVTLLVDDGSDTDCSMGSDSFIATVSVEPVPVIKIRQ